MKLELHVGPELFRFETMQRWVSKGKSWYANCGARPVDTIAIDAAGRVVRYGAQFMRADREDTYPIVVYAADPETAPPR